MNQSDNYFITKEKREDTKDTKLDVDKALLCVLSVLSFFLCDKIIVASVDVLYQKILFSEAANKTSPPCPVSVFGFVFVVP